MKISAAAANRLSDSTKESPMELVSPGATTTSPTPQQDVDAGAPEQPALRLSVARTALLGLVGSTAIVVGAVVGGQSFETHLPGAWFFGMPGGPGGSLGSNSSLPPVASLALVFGGLILLSRVLVWASCAT